jgi:VIT1/CCC1 family predicted Fe2+/Mn2+ transporter
MAAEDPFDEQIKDYSLGFMDSLIVSCSTSAGLVAAGFPKEMILTAIVIESISGALSMGLADYIGVDSVKDRKDIAWKSGARVSFAFLLGAIGIYLSYALVPDVETGFKISIIYSIVALVLFGYCRSYFLKISAKDSIGRVVFVGVISLIITYYLSTYLKVSEEKLK